LNPLAKSADRPTVTARRKIHTRRPVADPIQSLQCVTGNTQQFDGLLVGEHGPIRQRGKVRRQVLDVWHSASSCRTARYPAPLCNTMTSENSGNKRAINGQQFPELFADLTRNFGYHCVKHIYFALKLLRVI
jgi:hypothetical protein